jgi:uncharacterized protein YbjT (DUF2867 family)
MTIVILGGSGLIGSKLVNLLRQDCHNVVSTGVRITAHYENRGELWETVEVL